MFSGIFSKFNPPQRPKSALVFEGEMQFSIQHLRHVHNQLVENKVVTSKNILIVVESLRTIAEMVVYGDANSELLFDFFCEKNMLPLFIEIMWSPDCHVAVHTQILQTLGILCQSVKNNTSLYYLLSGNYINDIINYPFSFENENISEHFVSFLKTLSLRLNLQTVQFFFIEETGAFPLLTRAIGLLQFKEPMVRIAAQAIILNVYKVRDKRSRDYALQTEIMNRFFKNMIQLMMNQYNNLVSLCVDHMVASQNSIATSRSSSDGDISATLTKLEELMHDLLINIEDWMFYVQDVIDLGIMKLRRAFVQYVITNLIYPVLLQPLLKLNQFQDVENVFRTRRNSTQRAISTVNQNTAANAGLSSRKESVESPTTVNEIEQKKTYTFYVSLVVSLMYLQMMVRIVSDEMLRRAIMVALVHPISKKQRKKLLMSLMRGSEFSSMNSPTHMHALLSASTAGPGSMSAGNSQDNLSGAAFDVGDELGSEDNVQSMVRPHTGEGVLPSEEEEAPKIKIQPDYFGSNSEQGSGRSTSNNRNHLHELGDDRSESSDSDVDAIRDSELYRATMTLSTAYLPSSLEQGKSGQSKDPHYACSEFSSYCGGAGGTYCNIYRCAMQSCLLGNTERFNLLSLLLFHACFEKWVTYCMTVQLPIPSALLAAVESSPVSKRINITSKTAVETKRDDLPMQSSSEVAVNVLWYLQGLHMFPASFELPLEELHSLYALDETARHIPDSQQDMPLGRRDVTPGTDVPSDGEGHESDSDDGEYYHEANRPIAEEHDDLDVIDLKSAKSNGAGWGGSGSGAMDPDVLSANRLEILNIAGSQINDRIKDPHGAAGYDDDMSLAGSLSMSRAGGYAASFAGANVFSMAEQTAGGVNMPIIEGSNGGALSILEVLIQTLYQASSHTLTSVQVAVNTIYSVIRLFHITVMSPPTEPAAADAENSVGAEDFKAEASAAALKTYEKQTVKYEEMCRHVSVCICWILSKLHGAYIQAVQAVLERANSSKGDNVLSIMQEELRRVNNSKWNNTVNKMSQDVLLLLLPTPAVQLRMGLEHSIPISVMEMIRREVQIMIMIRALVMHIHQLLPHVIHECSQTDSNVGTSVKEAVSIATAETEAETISASGSVTVPDAPPAPSVPSPAHSDFTPVTKTSANDLFKDVVDDELLQFSDKDVSTSYSSYSDSAGSQLEEGDLIQTADYIAVRATTVLYYAMIPEITTASATMAAASNFLSPTRVTSVLGGSVGRESVGILGTSLVTRKVGDILFILNNSRLMLATLNVDDDGQTGVVRVLAPIIQTDVSIDSTDKRSLRLLVRSTDPVSCMCRVGDTIDVDGMNGLISPMTNKAYTPGGNAGGTGGGTGTRGMTLITATGSLNGGHSHAMHTGAHSRQNVSKMSPCALQARQQSTLWQMTLLFESEVDCADAARHIEVRRRVDDFCILFGLLHFIFYILNCNTLCTVH